MKKLILLVAAAALLFPAQANADAPPNKGQQGSNEVKSTGKPVDPNGFGTVVSQTATTSGGMGSHTSSFAPGQDPNKQPAQRLGVGNVARNDQALADLSGNPNTGTRPGDHAEVIYDLDNNPFTDPDLPPGKPR